MTGGVSSFWGPVTSTHEWCEPNYAYSSYIAEYFNTISNVPCIILALIGLVNALRQRFEKRFSVLHISNMILSIGSMLYHATLQRLLSSFTSFHPGYVAQIRGIFFFKVSDTDTIRKYAYRIRQIRVIDFFGGLTDRIRFGYGEDTPLSEVAASLSAAVPAARRRQLLAENETSHVNDLTSLSNVAHKLLQWKFFKSRLYRRMQMIILLCGNL